MCYINEQYNAFFFFIGHLFSIYHIAVSIGIPRNTCLILLRIAFIETRKKENNC